jgi:hypothetical protein
MMGAGHIGAAKAEDPRKELEEASTIGLENRLMKGLLENVRLRGQAGLGLREPLVNLTPTDEPALPTTRMQFRATQPGDVQVKDLSLLRWLVEGAIRRRRAILEGSVWRLRWLLSLLASYSGERRSVPSPQPGESQVRLDVKRAGAAPPGAGR